MAAKNVHVKPVCFWNIIICKKYWNVVWATAPYFKDIKGALQLNGHYSKTFHANRIKIGHQAQNVVVFDSKKKMGDNT